MGSDVASPAGQRGPFQGGTTHVRSRHDRSHSRLLGDAAQLGGLGQLLRGQGLQGHRSCLSRARGRGRVAQRRPDADRRAHGARRSSTTSSRSSQPLDNPIIMGHSAGGVFTQLLLDKGYGASAVVLNSAPTEGVKVAPWSQLRSTFPVLKNPANRHRAAGFTFEQFHYAFTNGVDEEIARPLYERYAVAGQRRDPVRAASSPTSSPATRTRGSTTTTTTARRCCSSPARTDHIMPPSVQQSNAKHYKSDKTHHRDHRVRGPALHAGARGLGEDRRPRARVGARQRPSPDRSRPEPCRSSPPPTASRSSTRTGAPASRSSWRTAGRSAATAGRRSSSTSPTTASARSRTTAAGTAAPRRCGTATTWTTTRTISRR